MKTPGAPCGAPFFSFTDPGTDRTDMISHIAKQHPSRAKGLWQALSDPRLFDVLGEAPPSDCEHVRQRVTRLQSGRSPRGAEVWLSWTIFHGGRLVGWVRATIAPDRTASIAFALCPNVLGQVAPRAACQQLLRALLETDVRQHSLLALRLPTSVRGGFSKGPDLTFCAKPGRTPSIMPPPRFCENG